MAGRRALKGRPPIFKCCVYNRTSGRTAAIDADAAPPWPPLPHLGALRPPPSAALSRPRASRARRAVASRAPAHWSALVVHHHTLSRADRCALCPLCEAPRAAAQAAQTAPVRARRVRISPRFPLAAAGCRRPRCSRACGRRGLALCALAPLCVFVRALPRRPRCGRPAAAGRSWGVRVGLLGRRDPRRG